MIRWFVGHPTAANLLLVLLLALGVTVMPTLKRETFPDFRPTEAEVTVVYRGAAAADVENAICGRLWDALGAVEGLDELTCAAQENVARAIATMAEGHDAARFVNDLRTETGAIDDFPDQADPPVVRELHRTDFTAPIAIAGDLPPAHLERYAVEIQNRLSALPGVARVTVSGFGERQFRISTSRAILQQHGLSASQLAGIVTAQSVDRPVGALETGEQTISLRFADERGTVAELSDLTVLSLPNGADLTLGQIADISETYSPDEERAYLDGQRAVFLQVEKALGADSLIVFGQVSDFVDAEAATLPAGVRLEIVQNITSLVRDRLTMLVKNGLIGLILVLVVMSIFFRPGFALWAAIGVPAALLGAFITMAVLGLSLNMMTLVALLMSIGIVMDDSIVISDAVAEASARGLSNIDAAVEGTRKVLPGVLSSFGTTIAVFGPLSFLSGQLGAVLKVLPVVLIAALAASLVEAFWVLPHHLRHGLKSMEKAPSRLRAGFDRQFERLRDRGLGRLVDFTIRWRYLVVGVTIAMLIVTVGLVGAGFVQREAIPDIDGDVVEARILMPQGTPLARTEAVVDEVIAALAATDAVFAPDQPGGQALVKTVEIHFNRNQSARESGSHVATISVGLLDAETRATTLNQVLARWREEVGAVPGAIAVTLTEPGLGPQGVAIEIRLAATDLNLLAQAGDRVLAELNSYTGVFNATHDLRPGKPEIHMVLADGATAIGLTAQEISRQLGTAFLGQVIATVQAGDIAHEIELEQSAEDRRARDDLRDFMVATPSGATVPLSTVAVITETRGWGNISQVNGVRTVTVEAEVDGRFGNADAIVGEVRSGFLPDLIAAMPGLSFEIGGASANAAETAGSILRGFILGLIGIYAILAFQFRSFVEPIIVMLAIPLSFIGVVLGHMVMGYNISMPSLVGAVSLAGIVVNNSILLVHVIKSRTAEGMSLPEAAGQASRDRFRAIVVSVSTTMMGMLPLLAETSLQAQVLKPLVISVVFGLLTSTILVLLVLPAAYAILHDLGVARVGEKAADTA
ncbi:MAG: efflux RND transporter permease subunit [Alphaproteobacteria bacterium]